MRLQNHFERLPQGDVLELTPEHALHIRIGHRLNRDIVSRPVDTNFADFIRRRECPGVIIISQRVSVRRAMDEVLDTQCAKLAITRKLTATMREVWGMQPRFDMRSGQRPYRLIESPRFRMAYDFLALRAASGEVPAELEAWWRGFNAGDADTRKAMLLPETGTRKRRRRRRKNPPATPTPTPA